MIAVTVPSGRSPQVSFGKDGGPWEPLALVRSRRRAVAEWRAVAAAATNWPERLYARQREISAECDLDAALDALLGQEDGRG